MSEPAADVTNLWRIILEGAARRRRRIGIGLARLTSRIVQSLRAAEEYVEVVVVGQPVPGFVSVAAETPDELVRMAKDGTLDGIVRGNFDALAAYDSLRRVLGVRGGVHEVNFFSYRGINLIDEDARGVFCLLPGSFVNERTLVDRMRAIDLHLELFGRLGFVPKLGILAPGKPADILDGVPEVNQGLAEAAFLVDWYQRNNVWAMNFNHQIEYAVQQANIIVAPNAWAGNLAGHCLLYLGNGSYLGGIAVNIPEIIYVDDSEAMQDFTNCLILAGFLANAEFARTA